MVKSIPVTQFCFWYRKINGKGRFRRFRPLDLAGFYQGSTDFTHGFYPGILPRYSTQ